MNRFEKLAELATESRITAEKQCILTEVAISRAKEVVACAEHLIGLIEQLEQRQQVRSVG